MRTTRKQHIPAPGKAVGLQGIALCGRWAHYRTGDHGMIRSEATAAAQKVERRADASTWCRDCIWRAVMAHRSRRFAPGQRLPPASSKAGPKNESGDNNLNETWNSTKEETTDEEA